MFGDQIVVFLAVFFGDLGAVRMDEVEELTVASVVNVVHDFVGVLGAVVGGIDDLDDISNDVIGGASGGEALSNGMGFGSSGPDLFAALGAVEIGVKFVFGVLVAIGTAGPKVVAVGGAKRDAAIGAAVAPRHRSVGSDVCKRWEVGW
jgi:hypothetical protein